MRKLSLSEYISLTILAGMLIFTLFFTLLGVMSAALVWAITRGEYQEDRLFAMALSFIFGTFVQFMIMGMIL